MQGKDHQSPSEDQVQRSLHVEGQELPGCLILSESPSKISQIPIPRVCLTHAMMAITEVTFMIFQIISSAPPNKKDGNNEYKIKIFKIIGKSSLVSAYN